MRRQTSQNPVTKLALQARVYQICIERNSRVHGQVLQSVEAVVQLIVQDIIDRIYSLPGVKKASIAAKIARGLGI